MHFQQSAKTTDFQARLKEFMAAHVYPSERRFHAESSPLPEIAGVCCRSWRN